MTRYLLLIALGFGCAACPKPPVYPACKTDKDCSEKSERCVFGKCEQCIDDKDCAEGQICQRNICVAKPECAADADCAEGQGCQDGRCVEAQTSAARACEVDQECEANERCVEVVVLDCGLAQRTAIARRMRAARMGPAYLWFQKSQGRELVRTKRATCGQLSTLNSTVTRWEAKPENVWTVWLAVFERSKKRRFGFWAMPMSGGPRSTICTSVSDELEPSNATS